MARSSTQAAPHSFLPAPVAEAAPYLGLLLAVFTTYAAVYGNAFVYDDHVLILHNAYLKDWSALPTLLTSQWLAGAHMRSWYYRPLQALFCAILYHAFGFSLTAYHLFSLGLHAANACLVYRLGRKLNFNPWAVFFAALIWALHPLHTEAIAYISASADPLCALFCLLGILLLLPDCAPRKFFLVLPLFLLALLSKEDGLVFPLIAASCIFYTSPQRFSLKPYLRLWPLSIVLGLYITAREVMQLPFNTSHSLMVLSQTQGLHTWSMMPPPYTAFAALAEYFRLLFWPDHLHFERGFPTYLSLWQAPVLCGVLLVGLAYYFVLWRQERKNLALSFGILWFFAAHALHANILYIVNHPILEHWMYLPTIGLFLGLAETCARSLKNLKSKTAHNAVLVASVLIVFTFGVQTYAQTGVWHNDETLYGNIFANGETSPHAHNNLGMLYDEKGDYRRAQEQLELAIQSSDDTLPEAEYNLAIVILHQQVDKAALQEAIIHLRRSLELDPDDDDTNSKLADCYEQLGDSEQTALYRSRADVIHKKFTPNVP